MFGVDHGVTICVPSPQQSLFQDSRLPELPARRTAQAPSIRAAAGMALSASEPSLGRSGAGVRAGGQGTSPGVFL